MSLLIQASISPARPYSALFSDLIRILFGCKEGGVVSSMYSAITVDSKRTEDINLEK